MTAGHRKQAEARFTSMFRCGGGSVSFQKSSNFWEIAVLGIPHATVPLTLTLSLREREQPSPRPGKFAHDSGCCFCSMRFMDFAPRFPGSARRTRKDARSTLRLEFESCGCAYQGGWCGGEV